MKKQKRERTRAAQVQRKPNPDGLAEFLRNPPIKPTKNQNVFLDKTYYEPYCPDDMYANLDFICHEVFFQLSDAELGTLLKMPNWDPFVVVENLCWYHMAQPGHDMLASPDAIIGYLREIATALESDRNECFGRNIKLWFRKANSPIWEVQPWQQKRVKFLLGSRPFKTELEQLNAQWPKGFKEFYNHHIPHWWMFYSASHSSVFNSDITPLGDYPQKFVSQVREFVIRWNIESLTMNKGKLDFVPARVQCVTDVYGQGTYVFIPRYYNWSRIKNDQGDFAHVKAMLDETFERFSPPKTATLAERIEDCKRYVQEKLVGNEMTDALIQKHVMHWSWQKIEKGKNTEPFFRINSPEHQARYYRAVRKLLMQK